MGQLKFGPVLLCILFLAKGLLLFGQTVGESEVTSIQLRKPSPDLPTGDSDRGRTDISPPLVQIITPQLDSAQTTYISSSSSYLIGRIIDESGIQSLTINDSIVSIDENGFFQQTYSLRDGLNVFKIVASDESANSTTQLVTMIRDAHQGEVAVNPTSDYPGDFYALIIAVNTYNDPALPSLDHPVTDATFLYSTLMGNYTFDPENISLLRDATRADIIRALDRLSFQLSPQDNLLIFYAGHGYWDEIKETGYWLPSDAEQSSSVNWIRNSTIQDYIDDINTRHTLLITDACFAGAIFKTRGAFQDASIAVNKLYSLSSRKAMTSGNLKEVPDKSVFIEYFLKRLLDNQKKYISSGELYNSFREAVLNNSPNIPLYGVIQDAGDEGGEFIFIKR